MLYRVSLYAEGYYSGATYEEIRYTENEGALDLIDTEIYVGELDGKHSEVCGYIHVCEVDAKDEYEVSNENSCLKEYLEKMNVKIVEPNFGKIKKTILCSKLESTKIDNILEPIRKHPSIDPSRIDALFTEAMDEILKSYHAEASFTRILREAEVLFEEMLEYEEEK